MVAPPWYELPPQGYGGLEVIVAALVDGLVDRGHEVTLFGAGTSTGTRARFVSTNPELQYPRLGELMPAVLHGARVNQLIADGDFDVVHDHTTDGPMTAPIRRIPTVVTVHGPVDGEFGDYFAALGNSVRLVAISQAQRSRRPGLAWAATVHNALPDVVTESDVASDAARDRPGGQSGSAASGAARDPDRPGGQSGSAASGAARDPDRPVLWLARFTADKGPDLAIEACRAAGVPLVLAGKCNEKIERRYLADVIRPAMHDGVQLVVNAERARTRELLRQARCLIMPIRWAEPFGMVMIEAMAVGTPVVGLRRGAVPELVLHGVTGWLADEPEELPELLKRVDELDPEDCVKHVQTNFGAGLMARRYERVYLDALARPEPVAGHRRRLTDIRPMPAPVLRRPDRRPSHLRQS
jgi:glycosyltransferase involved in cell wall biosynthesis